MKRLLCLILAAFVLAGCGQVGAENAPTSAFPEPTGIKVRETLPSLQKIPEARACIMDDYRINYEIFVRSFQDGNGDGVGDLPGVLSKLDYIQKELGAGGLWLMPIHPSPSYHKYDVTDYYDVDPSYGTMADFEALSEECDNRGIHLILDLVLNHTSWEHPWFQAAADYLSSLPRGAQPNLKICPYVDYYHFRQAEKCPQGYCPLEKAEGWFYEGHFGPCMPDLNFDSPQVLAEMEKIMAFWISKGVDGFRLDAVKEYESGRTDRNIEILHWITNTVRTLSPNCYIVGEVWDSFTELARYYKSGVKSIFNYPFGSGEGKIIKVLRAAGNEKMVSTYAPALQKADTFYRSKNPDYIDAPFLTNHDVGRIAGFVNRDPNKVKLAGAMNLFMSGSTFLYYGEEIGMVCGKADDPSYRCPMVWKPGTQAIEPPPGCTLPESYPFGSLEEQMDDPSSVFRYYQAAAAIRNAVPALSHGIPTVEEKLNKGCVSAVRKTYEDEQCIVLMNIDPQDAQVDLGDYRDWELSGFLTTSSVKPDRKEDVLFLPAWGVAVFTKNA